MIVKPAAKPKNLSKLQQATAAEIAGAGTTTKRVDHEVFTGPDALKRYDAARGVLPMPAATTTNPSKPPLDQERIAKILGASSTVDLNNPKGEVVNKTKQTKQTKAKAKKTTKTTESKTFDGNKKTTKTTKAKAPKATNPAAPKLSMLDAAAIVLDGMASATTKEIVDLMADRKLWISPAGKTPANTLYAAIAREIKVKGKESRFTKADKGFRLVKFNEKS